MTLIECAITSCSSRAMRRRSSVTARRASSSRSRSSRSARAWSSAHRARRRRRVQPASQAPPTQISLAISLPGPPPWSAGDRRPCRSRRPTRTGSGRDPSSLCRAMSKVARRSRTQDRRRSRRRRRSRSRRAHRDRARGNLGVIIGVTMSTASGQVLPSWALSGQQVLGDRLLGHQREHDEHGDPVDQQPDHLARRLSSSTAMSACRHRSQDPPGGASACRVTRRLPLQAYAFRPHDTRCGRSGRARKPPSGDDTAPPDRHSGDRAPPPRSHHMLHHQLPGSDQAVRIGLRRRRPVLRRRSRSGDRVLGAERIGQDHHAAHPARAGGRHGRHGHDRPPGLPSLPDRCARSAPPWTAIASIRAAAPTSTCGLSPRRPACHVTGSTRSSAWSGWPTSRAAASAGSRSACASGSAWPGRCSATPAC